MLRFERLMTLFVAGSLMAMAQPALTTIEDTL
jgi:hypothetical protein